ncbi:MAG: glycosyltransferase family 4 protein [Planctomycetes bacterium]|jgi:glycosyltransferase involved in cell wall biosynthesis|nr:glycosyltransferase family 4 protein [Planctomycetota bacterium]
MRLPIALDYRPALLSRAGIGRATRELAAALARQPELVVHLYAHSLARAVVPTAVPPDAHLHRLPLPGRAAGLLQRLGLGADRLAGGAAVFHWTDYVQPPLSRARAVLTVHDLAFVREPAWHGADAAPLRERTARAIAAAAAVIVPSRTTAADLQQFAPTARAVHVVPFGADHVPTAIDTAALPVPVSRPYALCIGTLEPRKNHLALLAAWRRLPAGSPRLVVVGGIGWECAAIVDELQRAVADGLALWLPRADDALLWRLLAAAQLLVYPSLWEGFGFPPLEAMQLGVPVVAHDAAPMQELGDGALSLVDAREPLALAAAIERLLGDPVAHAAASAAGRTRAAAFRWRDCAAAHAAIYRQVAAC